MNNIIIFGAGGFAREVAFVIKEINRVSSAWNILGFSVLDGKLIGKKVGDCTIYCSEKEVLDMKVSAVIGVGNPSIIQSIAEKFHEIKTVSFPNIIHPGTVVDKESLTIGSGNVVCAGVFLTTNIRMGSFNILNLCTTIGHDVEIGDCCVINPGVNISGGVIIGNKCLIGTGATILQNLRINDNVTIGAGAVVTKDIPPGTTVVGVPARPLNQP